MVDAFGAVSQPKHAITNPKAFACEGRIALKPSVVPTKLGRDPNEPNQNGCAWPTSDVKTVAPGGNANITPPDLKIEPEFAGTSSNVATVFVLVCATNDVRSLNVVCANTVDGSRINSAIPQT